MLRQTSWLEYCVFHLWCSFHLKWMAWNGWSLHFTDWMGRFSLFLSTFLVIGHRDDRWPFKPCFRSNKYQTTDRRKRNEKVLLATWVISALWVYEFTSVFMLWHQVLDNSFVTRRDILFLKVFCHVVISFIVLCILLFTTNIVFLTKLKKRFNAFNDNNFKKTNSPLYS